MYLSATIDTVPIILEIPEDPHIGLMNRIHLPWNLGMIFYNSNNFWMKNTRIPLDIGFFDKNKRLIQVTKMEPLSLKTIFSPKETKYAVETNQGWYEKNKIGTNALLQLCGEIKWGE